MLQKELKKHQWKAFLRHPMFERNMSVRIFMYIIFGIMGLQLLSLSFFLDKVLMEIGSYTHAIDSFNAFLLYLFMFDFLIKYIMKQNQSMQIAPYLTLPIKRNRLFNFLLSKEFSNIWNLYLFFLIAPFAFKSATPDFGFGATLLYILFIYSLCLGNSLLVNITNNLLKRNGWFFFLPIVILVFIGVLSFLPGVTFGEYTVQIGEWVLHGNPFVWLVQILILTGLWLVNQRMMREALYRELQGKKITDTVNFSHISFLDRLGETGEFINLELKMIFRSKRLKQQMYAVGFFFIYYFVMLYSSNAVFHQSPFMLIFFSMFVIGSLGLIMSQFMFTAESSFFDGIMARHQTLLPMLKGKYILYTSYALLPTLCMMVPVFQGKLSLFFVISVFFYTVGFLFFLMFQNAVYNKSYFDLFDSGMFNWKGTSGNMLMVTMFGMFFPVIIIVIIHNLFSQEVACSFMLVVGLSFTLSAKYWLRWTYNRFLKRRHKNMEGFRSNA